MIGVVPASLRVSKKNLVVLAGLVVFLYHDSVDDILQISVRSLF